jgi:hypothetical protein
MATNHQPPPVFGVYAKTFSAVIGASAIVTLWALGDAASSEQSGLGTVVSAPGFTFGVSTTPTTPPLAP